MTPPPDPGSSLPAWHAALLLGPTLAAIAAALCARSAVATVSAWRVARWAATAAPACAAASLVAVLAGHTGAAAALRADIVGALVLLLVNFIGWVIVGHSRTSLAGEPGERRYLRWLMATLASVSLVVVTNHLLVLALAWMASSFALHRLLTFFGERPAAVLAAHKKFIVARAADLCMLAAAGLLFVACGTLQIDRLVAQAALPGTAQAAVVLIACAALLKCAQLPFHGWLIQVMEAPTPVSALLHAGVVNLGGFVLIRFAPLVVQVPAAQALLVVAGAATAVLAALVASTRISIKVSLAWSTCAQMGFMLLECGLGAWGMALLHLLAHSLYKAHAFLAAGGAVRRAMLAQLVPPAAAPGPLALATGASLGLGMTLAAGALVGVLMPAATAPSPASWVLAGILALALVPLVHGQAWRLGGLWLPALGLGAFGSALAYFGLHALFAGRWLPVVSDPPAVLWMGVALAFAGLFLLQSLIVVAPHGPLARRLYPWFYGGLFLDEQVSRLAFALWHPPAPEPVSSDAALLPPAERHARRAASTVAAGARA